MSDVAFRMTVYAPKSVDATEATILTPAAGAAHSDQFKVSTMVISGWKNIMQAPRGRRGRLDHLSKKTDVGVMVVKLVDTRTTVGGTNLTRWVTAFLGDTNGNPNWASLKVYIESSTNGGGAWASFFTGRIRRIRLTSKLEFEMECEDPGADFARMRLFVGRPNRWGLSPAVDFNVWPVSIGPGSYGRLTGPHTIPTTIATNVTSTVEGVSTTDAQVRVTTASADTAVLDALTAALDPANATGTLGTGPHGGGSFSPHIIAILTRTDTGKSGWFKVGPVQMSTFVKAGATLIGAQALMLRPGRKAAGIATGTPLTNGVPPGTNGAGATSVVTDGWTASQTGIVKAGDLLRFGTENRHYRVTADANSNGSGQATISITPALANNIADNTAITASLDRFYMPTPAVGVACTLRLQVDRAAEKSNPVVVTDRHPVQLLKDVLDGYFGWQWRERERLPTGKAPGDPKETVPYDSTAFTTLIADQTFVQPLRVWQTEVVQAAEWVEKYIGQVAQIGYYFDADGRLVPVDLRMPTSTAGLSTVTDADLAKDGGGLQWSHSVDGAISRYVLKFYEEDLTLPTAATATGLVDLVSKISTGSQATLQVNALAHEWVLLDLLGAQVGDRAYTVDARTIRCMRAKVLGSVVADGEVAALPSKIFSALTGLSRAYGLGPIELGFKLRLGASVTAQAWPGRHLLVDVDAFPDPGTHLRGGVRLVRVVERSEDGPVVEIRAVDLGENVTANTPTAGAPALVTGNGLHAIQSAITVNAQADPVEVQLHATTTATGTVPANTSDGWGRTQMVLESRTVSWEGLASGVKYWVRARSIPGPGKTLKLPSAWVTTASVTTTTLGTPTALAASSVTARRALVTWVNAEATYGVVVYASSPSGDPTQLVAKLPPGTNFWEMLDLTPSTSYKVEVAHVDRFGGEGAKASTTFSTTTTEITTAPAGVALAVLVGDTT